MREFFREYYFELTTFFELTAAVTGIFTINKYRHSKVKYFIYFLIYILILELIGAYPYYIRNLGWFPQFANIIEGTFLEHNYWWYFFGWSFLAYAFFLFFYNSIVEKPQFKYLIKIAAGLFVLSFFITIWVNFDTFTIRYIPSFVTFNAFVVAFCIVLYFTELLQTDKILNIKKSFYFFASAALFIYTLAITPLSFYTDYFRNADWNFVFLQYEIYLLMNGFLYLTFAFALLWCKPKQDL